MATNKRLNPTDFSVERLKKYSKEELINEILILRAEIAVFKNWKGDGFKPNTKDNQPLKLHINEGENVSEYTAFFALGTCLCAPGCTWTMRVTPNAVGT